MKLTELYANQRVAIQLMWGEQKIEFFSTIIANDGTASYGTAYIHNGSPLNINVVPGNGISCNLFADDISTGHRVSWKNIELTTVERDGKPAYCFKTFGFNNNANHDDRRLHARTIIQVKGTAYEKNPDEGVDILVHDISDIGISFFAPKGFNPGSHQVTVAFMDRIDDRRFDVKVECTITRSVAKDDQLFVGCKIMGENKDYRLYGFIKRLKAKTKGKGRAIEDENKNEDKNADKSEDKNEGGEE